MAQTKPITGDIQSNIDNHKKLIDLASSEGAEIIIFPELSLTGYEPSLAKDLATHQDDSRFDDFQTLSDSRQITIGVGVPTKNKAGICVSLLLFQPGQARRTYSKQYLHPDEEAFFINGPRFTGLIGDQATIAPAICYEISVPAHAEQAFKRGASIYIASVAKFVNGIDIARKRLAEIAAHYSMTVFMSNCIGRADGADCAGQTSIWNNKGVLAGQLNDTHEGLLIFDTETQELIVKTL